jgi:colanic acid/amylovoran biosynthesis glycosyltransferase
MLTEPKISANHDYHLNQRSLFYRKNNTVMKAIRLAYLVSQYPAISITFILREIRTLRRLGFEIQVASINVPDRSDEGLTVAEREEKLDTFYVKQAGLIGALKAHVYTLFTQPLSYLRGLGFALRLGQFDLKKILYGFFYFVEAVMVGQWMRRHHFSHLHIHFGMAAATVGLITKQIFPIKFSITIHGPDEFYNTLTYYLKQKILEADFICCISHFARSQLMMLSPPSVWDKFEISPLGVDPAQFPPQPVRESAAPFEILCVGRLVPVKGQFILLKAVTQLLAESRVLRLRYVGDGPDREALEEAVKQQGLTDHILFEGAVNQDRILTFYNSADAFVLASFAEGLPVVLMEAMVMEIPCITTHITGVPELIKTGENGLTVPASSVLALVEAMRLLMDKPDFHRTIAQAGRQTVLEHYELQKNTERLANIFRKHLS